jgi:myo-inositol catabolism protein IolS
MISSESSEYFSLPGTNLRPTKVGLGGAPLGGHGWGLRNDQDACEAIKAAMNMGITFFDTADVYGLGLSESLLSKALSFDRNRVIISTKGGVRWDDAGHTIKDSTPKYLVSAVEDSLRRLNLDCIPLYFLHWQDGITPLRDSIEALLDLKKKGKIQAVGLSNIKAQDFCDCIDLNISAIQVKGNLLEPEELFCINRVAQKHGVPIISFSVLSDGLLSGSIDSSRNFGLDDHRARYPLFQRDVFSEVLKKVDSLRQAANKIGRSMADIAIRWPIDIGLSDSVLFGAKNSMQVKKNMANINQVLPLNFAIELGMVMPYNKSDEFEEYLLQRYKF